MVLGKLEGQQRNLGNYWGFLEFFPSGMVFIRPWPY